MRGAIAVVIASVLVAGCNDSVKDMSAVQGDEAASAAVSGGSSASASASASSAGGASSVAESNDVWDFQYSYPESAGRIPELRAILDERRAKALTQLKEDAIEGRAMADESGYPFNAYVVHVEWKTVTDLPDWLSLSSETYAFTGGAHGNIGFDTILWDKRTGKAISPSSLFVSVEAVEGALRNAFCAALNKQREERRGEPVVPDSDDWMTACPGISNTTMILGSSNSRTFDRIGFLIDPYTAGPYAEGTYEATVPVTKAIMATVKPEYAGSFTVVR